MSNRIKVKKTHKLKLQVHLYSFICHLQVVSHGTIAYMKKNVCIFKIVQL